MATINVDELRVGMILSDNIYDKNGRFIISKGTLINDKHIKILKIWGVTEAPIEGLSENNVDNNKNAPEKIDNLLFKEAEKIIAKKFCHTNFKDEVVKELIKLCIIRSAEHPINKDNNPIEPDRNIIDSKKNQKYSRAYWEDLIDKKINLPSLPQTYNRIIEVVNHPYSSAKNIADVVNKDTSLTAKLLQLANSSFYGFSSKIDSISEAILRIGTKQTSALAIGITVISYFKNIPNDMISMESFWKHSICCSIAARIIASHNNTINTERLFIGGLLHDIGRLIMFQYQPALMKEALLNAKGKEDFLYNTENEILGIRHSEIGKILIKKWKIPVSIENIIAYHHKPLSSQNPLEPAIINLADILAHALTIGSSGELFVPPIDPKVLEILNISKSIFSPTIKQIDRQFNEIIHFFI